MLTAADMLDIADAGASSSPVRRAMLIVALAERTRTEAALAAMPVGRWNAALLEARRAALGEQMACRVACLACGEPLELALGASELLAQASAVPTSGEPFEIVHGELRLAARLPNVGDLLAIEQAGEQHAAERALLARCVIEAHVLGDPVTIDMLPETALLALSVAIRARDPLVETSLNMRCPACDHAWQAALDIAAFVWREFAALADRIAREVDMLARAYGWSEREILSLSARRRRRYLDMIEA
jgi:hypothetical protein